MQRVKCPECGWPTKADPYKAKKTKLIKCKRCKQSFNPFPDSPDTDK